MPGKKSSFMKMDLPIANYVCRIREANDDPLRKGVFLKFDIEDGEYKNHFQSICQESATNNFYYIGRIDQSCTGRDKRKFHDLILAIEKSNPGYKFVFIHKGDLVGKLIGLRLRKYQITRKDRTKWPRLEVLSYMTVDDARAENSPEGGCPTCRNSE